MLSVVIPALNAAETLPATLASVRGAAGEMIVADGGSTDRTRDVAEAEGARVVQSAPGRGPQMIAGAGEARGGWLLFLHADTVLSEGWAEAAEAFMAAPENAKRAAYFRFALDDESAAARRLARLVALRNRLFGLAYGDQGLLIARDFYEALGGFEPWPLFEDVDLVRRIGRKRLSRLPADAVTSAAAFRKQGYLRRSARNLILLSRYYAGASPEKLARAYKT